MRRFKGSNRRTRIGNILKKAAATTLWFPLFYHTQDCKIQFIHERHVLWSPLYFTMSRSISSTKTLASYCSK